MDAKRSHARKMMYHLYMHDMTTNLCHIVGINPTDDAAVAIARVELLNQDMVRPGASYRFTVFGFPLDHTPPAELETIETVGANQINVTSPIPYGPPVTSDGSIHVSTETFEPMSSIDAKSFHVQDPPASYASAAWGVGASHIPASYATAVTEPYGEDAPYSYLAANDAVFSEVVEGLAHYETEEESYQKWLKGHEGKTS